MNSCLSLMGEAEGDVVERCQMDLLQRLTMGGAMEAQFGRFERGGEEVELTLGLSLGGRFGVEKATDGKLERSSSVAGGMAVLMDEGEDEDDEHAGIAPGLVRTASLPVEAGEEWRKRKELQTLRRLEAKRRRSEKQRVVRGEEHAAAMAAAGGLLLLPAVGRGGLGGKRGLHGLGKKPSSPPGESQGGSSSGMSEPESKSGQGGGCLQGESRRGGECWVGMEREEEEEGAAAAARKEGRGRRGGVGTEEMPCVFTKGDGPNGRRVEGILYKYGKREEVRIMCVCHGRFLSPSDFIKHAGGSDLSNPLRRIVVTPSSSFI